MSDIECQLMFDRDVDLASEHAFGKCAASVIPQHLSHATELVYKTSHSSVRCPNHWAACFHATKNRICQVLVRSGGPLEPPVVGHIYEQVCSGTCVVGKDKLSGKLANRVFKTDQRRHMDIAIGQSEHSVFFSFFKIAGYLIAYNLRKQRHSVSTGNIFAKRHEVDLSINLHAFPTI